MLSHGGVIGASGAAAAGGGGSVTYYFNCDSKTDGQAPGKGSGVLTISSGLSVVTGAVGNALQGTTGWDNFTAPTSGNISASVGTIGFFIHPTANQSGQVLFSAVDSPGSDPDLSLFGISGASGYWFRYKNTAVDLTLASGITYFLELSWDGAANKMAVRLDGGSWSETTGLSGSNPTLATDMSFLTVSGLAGNAWIDQVIIGSSYQQDLYASRTNTSF